MSAAPPDRSRSTREAFDSPRAVVGALAWLRMLSRISEPVRVGVVVADNDVWFQYVNPEFAAQHAGTIEELTGAHLSHFYSPEELATTVQPIITAALERGIGRGEVTRLRRDGTQGAARTPISLATADAGGANTRGPLGTDTN